MKDKKIVIYARGGYGNPKILSFQINDGIMNVEERNAEEYIENFRNNVCNYIENENQNSLMVNNTQYYANEKPRTVNRKGRIIRYRRNSIENIH